jgi:hypothetical protein
VVELQAQYIRNLREVSLPALPPCETGRCQPALCVSCLAWRASGWGCCTACERSGPLSVKASFTQVFVDTPPPRTWDEAEGEEQYETADET